MRRTLLKLSTLVVLAMGVVMLQRPRPAEAARACCYGDCMQYCMTTGSFGSCHNTCNSDCEAC